MFLSLAPPGLIAYSVATSSNSDSSSSGDVVVTVPPTTPTAAPQKKTVHLQMDGKTYTCPAGTGSRLSPINERSASIQVRIDATRSQLKKIERRLKVLDTQYPGKTAPNATVDEYNGMLSTARKLAARDDRLVNQFNTSVNAHNKIIDEDCS